MRRTRVVVWDDVRDPSTLHVFGEITSGTIRIDRIFAQIFIGRCPIKVQSTFPVPEIHEDRVIAMKRCGHVT